VKLAGTPRARSSSMRVVAVACLVVAACTPCAGQRYVASGQLEAAKLQPELASCAGHKVCNAPCVDLFQLAREDVIETCRVTLDAQGNGTVVARYIDHTTCGGGEVLDPSSGDVVVDDGDWGDWSDDGSYDDGSSDDPCSDGSCDDGSSTDDGSTDDGSTDDGSTDDGGDGTSRTAPGARLVPADRDATAPARVDRSRD
jgi:hypothetical protein